MNDIYACPACSKKGKWRRGVEFDHEMICFRCWETWCPAERAEALRDQADALTNVDGDGI
jgi:hypothetical protein